jgi:hypothetical protein
MNYMNARFTNSIVKSSFLVAAVAVALSGCGGAGVANNSVATKLAMSYTVEIVEGPAGSTGLEFSKVSPNGTIAGRWGSGNGSICFIYKDGVRTDVTPENSDIRLTSVSDDGTIEGDYEVGSDLFPFSTSGVGFHDITKPGPYSEGSNAGRDSSGRSYVSFYNTNQTVEAYREVAGVYAALTVTGANDATLRCSSPSGYAAGTAFFSGTYKPVRFTPDSNVGTPFLEDLPNAAMLTINDHASVGGYVSEGSNYYPFVNVNGQTTQLAGLGGDFSQICHLNIGNVPYHAIGWSATEGQVDLTTRVPSTPGFTLARAYGIDKKGRIVGFGNLNGKQVGFIMTPVNP